MTLRDVITLTVWRQRETMEDITTTSLSTRSAIVASVHVDQGKAAICRRGGTTSEAHEKLPTEEASLEQEHLKKQQSDLAQTRID